MRAEIVKLALAVQILTRLPVDVGARYSAEHMAAAVRYYPLVGSLIGGLLGGAVLALEGAVSSATAILGAIVIGLMLTGAFHEDGLADTFDGIGGGRTRAAALDIMRDSRLGAYGALALLGCVSLKVALLSELPGAQVPWALLVAHTVSRLSSVLVIATGTYARDEGIGKSIAQKMTPASLLIAMACSIGALLVGLLGLPLAAVAGGIAAVALSHLLLRRWIERRIHGYTGDTLGAIQQAGELGFYAGMLWV